MYKLIVVRFDSSSFDDAEFNKFCEQHSILKIEKETLNSRLTAFWSSSRLDKLRIYS
ncbi:MAG: hypothetical protein M0R69_06530 [Candidatus Cloacimonetes bacterium]|jgi:hypothetical protein|nr:hypothetical protein [Candidatus Cloacimonadota bacterium]